MAVPEAYKPFIRLLVCLLFFLLGIAVYMSSEEHVVDCPDGSTDTKCTEGWTFIDALYFSMTTVSTVGYGDLSPGTDGTKFFTCIYILIGIAIIFPIMAGYFDWILDTVESLLVTLIFGKKKAEPGVDVDGDGDTDIPDPPPAIIFYGRGLFFPLTSMFIIVLFLSGFIFTVCEEEWTYWEGVYHCWITSTTVGYGDMTITTQEGRLWAAIHIFLSTAWLLAILGRLMELLAIRKRQLQQKEMMARSLDVELIKSLDKDGGGVDKLEFVTNMLITLGVELCGTPLQWSDVEPFIAKFDAMDSDSSGRLTASDLERMVQMELEKKRNKGKGSPTGSETKEMMKPVKQEPITPTNKPTTATREIEPAVEPDTICPEGEGGATQAIHSTPFRSPFKDIA